MSDVIDLAKRREAKAMEAAGFERAPLKVLVSGGRVHLASIAWRFDLSPDEARETAAALVTAAERAEGSKPPPDSA